MAARSLSEKIHELLFKKKMRAADLAREISVPPPTLHRIMTGKSPNPHRATLNRIANYFDISLEELKGSDSKTTETFLESKKSFVTEIPLVDWGDLDKLNSEESVKISNMILASNLDAKCFATQIKDSSMDSAFPKNTVLIFDPNKNANDQSFVLVSTYETRSYIFRKLLIDGEHKFLKTLNPEFSKSLRALDKLDRIVATLIEARHTYE